MQKPCAVVPGIRALEPENRTRQVFLAMASGGLSKHSLSVSGPGLDRAACTMTLSKQCCSSTMDEQYEQKTAYKNYVLLFVGSFPFCVSVEFSVEFCH